MINFKKIILSLMGLSAFLLPNLALAGKIDEVKKAVKDKCGGDIAEAQVLDSVLKAFDCKEGSEVKIANCAIKCLKANAGNVVGGK